jgi:hypothetical protein
MTEPNAIRDDIAFMRALAEEGRSGPLVGGSILAASGLSLGTASLVVWADLTWRLFPNGWAIAAIWMVSLAVFLTCLFGSKVMKIPTGSAPKAIGIAWSAAGWSIFFVGLSLVVMAVHGKDAYVTNAFMPFILAIYGSAWFLAAALTQPRWLCVAAFAAIGMALVTAWFAADGAVLYLVYALSLYVLTAAPRLVLARQARQAQILRAAA